MPTGGQERVSYLRIDYKIREKRGAYVRIGKKGKKPMDQFLLSCL